MGKRINESIIGVISATIWMVIFMIIVSTLYLDSNKLYEVNTNTINADRNRIMIPKDLKVRIYRKSLDTVEEIELEEYIMGVVSSEMPANFQVEAIKAQAVAARTFYLNKKNNSCKEALEHGADICDTVDCQVYMNKQERMALWDKEKADDYWKKIRNAVLETKGQVLTYKGELVKYPQYFAVSHGKTEDAVDVLSLEVPYLKSVHSEGEEIAPKYKSSIDIDIDTFVKKINEKYVTANMKKKSIENQIKIESYTVSGSVDTIKLGDIEIKGTDFRKIFNLNSSCFTLNIRNDIVSIVCTGYGHGLGMSQWGANYMAKDGKDYIYILKHYYTGVEIETLKYK